jgi:hypothetical protein
VAFASPRLVLRDVRVEGGSRFSVEDVLREAPIPLEENIFRVNLSRVGQALEELPPVERVQVIRRFPQSLLVCIEERRAAYQTRTDVEGAALYNLDRTGYVYEPAPARDPALPLLVLPARHAPAVGGSMTAALLETVEQCYRLAEERSLELRQVRVDEQSELWVDLERSDPELGDLPVRIGRWTELPEKFADIRLALDGRPELTHTAALLNVMCAGRPAYVPIASAARSRRGRP